MPDWRITRLRGKFALTFDHGGKRHRHTLGTDDPREAYLIAPAIYAELTRPSGRTVSDIWIAYTLDKSGKAVLATMEHTWKALKERFGSRDGENITKEDCRAHADERRRAGISDGTIHTELGHLRTVLKWAENEKIIGKAPAIERPQKPEPKDRYLTREEAHRILAEAKTPHVKLAMHLMLATAARVTAVLELTWDRVDFERKIIHLRDPSEKVKRKGRAIVPMTRTISTALQDAKAGALSEYVVEWAGKPVKSIKRGIASAANGAKLDGISAHVFRHTAAVWMAEAGRPMEEISQFMGHNSVEVTRRVYARYSPDHLRQAADALEMGLYVVPACSGEPTKRNERRNDA